MKLSEIKSISKDQGIKLSPHQLAQLIEINSICERNRLCQLRFESLSRFGFSVTENPMGTGFGVGLCIRKMANGSIRVRVSANWSGGFANYANCVHI